jgi:hypothetical protein
LNLFQFTDVFYCSYTNCTKDTGYKYKLWSYPKNDDLGTGMKRQTLGPPLPDDGPKKIKSKHCEHLLDLLPCHAMIDRCCLMKTQMGLFSKLR